MTISICYVVCWKLLLPTLFCRKSPALCRCLLRYSYRGIWSPVPPVHQLSVCSSVLHFCSSASWSLVGMDPEFHAAWTLVDSVCLLLKVLLSERERGDVVRSELTFALFMGQYKGSKCRPGSSISSRLCRLINIIMDFSLNYYPP